MSGDGFFLPHIRPGELSRAELADLTSLLRRCLRSDMFGSAAGMTTASGPAGLRMGLQQEGEFVAEILSGTQPYAWRRKVPAITGGADDDSTPLSGTVGRNPAYELNGSTSVGVGSLVKMWPWFYAADYTEQNYAFIATVGVSIGTFFPAKITASLAEDYSFTEQEFQPDGAFIDLPGGRSGVYNGLHPAHELNQTTGVANGTIVWMTEGDDNPNPAIGQEYEFAFPVGTGGLAKWIIFTLTATLTVTSATQTVNVVNYWQGTNPGATVTVHNMPANVNFVFSGSTGFYGMAVYDDRAGFYRIVQMQCG